METNPTNQTEPTNPNNQTPATGSNSASTPQKSTDTRTSTSSPGFTELSSIPPTQNTPPQKKVPAALDASKLVRTFAGDMKRTLAQKDVSKQDAPAKQVPQHTPSSSTPPISSPAPHHTQPPKQVVERDPVETPSPNATTQKTQSHLAVQTAPSTSSSPTDTPTPKRPHSYSQTQPPVGFRSKTGITTNGKAPFGTSPLTAAQKIAGGFGDIPMRQESSIKNTSPAHGATDIPTPSRTPITTAPNEESKTSQNTTSITSIASHDATTAAQQTIPPSTPQTPHTKPNVTKGIVHTFKDDVQNVVRKQQVSLVKIAALESERSSAAKKEKVQSIRSYTAAIIGLLLLLAGGGLLAGIYYVRSLDTAASPAVTTARSLIFSEDRTLFALPQNPQVTLLSDLEVLRKNVRTTLGSIIAVVVTHTVAATNKVPEHPEAITAPDFLAQINARLSESFARSLGDNYFLGVHVIDENIPILLLTTANYPQAFTGMLDWEKYIEEDLAPLFGQVSRSIRFNEQTRFSDIVIDNRDARVVRDTFGKITLLYSFVDRNTIVITTSPHTFREVLERLRASI